MSETEKKLTSEPGKSDLDELAAKLDKARDQKPEMIENSASPMGLGLKYASEFSAATLVGAALGYGFDKFFETAPWGMLAGLFLGLATGIREIVRSAKRDSEQPPL